MPKSSDNTAMVRVFALDFLWSLCLFTLLSAFLSTSTCTAMSLHTCTPDSCTCMQQVTELIKVDTGGNFTITISLKLPTSTMNKLSVGKICLVRYDKDIITGYWTDNAYFGRWTPNYSFEQYIIGCGVVKFRLSVHGAELNDDGKYHLEARTEIMNYTTRGQPLTVHVNDGQQTNVTSTEFKDEGKYHLESTTKTMNYTTQGQPLTVHVHEEQQRNMTSAETNGETREQKIKCDQACIANMQDIFDKLNDNLMKNQNALNEDLLRKLPPSHVIYGMLLATFLFSVCAVMLSAVLIVLMIRSRRHIYAPVSTPNNSIHIQTNILQVDPCASVELLSLPKPNAANGIAAETE